MEYKILEQIGEGGFGAVFRVRADDGSEYAMKTLSPQPQITKVVDFPHLKKRFEREVKYQSSVNHPNVARIIDHDLSADPPYFIMELAEGTLADDLASDRTLGGQPANPLFDIISGLEAIHEVGIVHRDLKPQNVLKFRGENGVYRYAVSDFGLMNATESQSTTLTATNVAGGTEMYAAPELLSDFKRATPSADIYSFGAILHDIFGGGAKRIPYTELNVPGAIGTVIQKCTKKYAKRRYQSIARLRDDLYEVLNSAEVEFSSSEEEEIIGLLTKSSSLTDDSWDRVFMLLDQNAEDGVSNRNVFRAITPDHVAQLKEDSPELFVALGRDFCVYVQNGAFDFDYCDVLADKLQVFYDLGDVGLKAIVAVALLLMGVNHNRWFVEHRFMRAVGPDAADALAHRFLTEVEVQEINLEHFVAHVERSIGVSRSRLHPRILNALGE